MLCKGLGNSACAPRSVCRRKGDGAEAGRSELFDFDKLLRRIVRVWLGITGCAEVNEGISLTQGVGYRGGSMTEQCDPNT
jgi:hypothetical protein